MNYCFQKHTSHIPKMLLLVVGLMSSGCRGGGTLQPGGQGSLHMHADDHPDLEPSTISVEGPCSKDDTLIEISNSPQTLSPRDPSTALLRRKNAWKQSYDAPHNASNSSKHNPRNRSIELLSRENERKQSLSSPITVNPLMSREADKKIRKASPSAFERAAARFRNTLAQDISGLNRNISFLKSAIKCDKDVATALLRMKRKGLELRAYHKDAEEDAGLKAIIKRVGDTRRDLEYLQEILQGSHSIFACCFGEPEIDMKRAQALMAHYPRLAPRIADKVLEQLHEDIHDYIFSVTGVRQQLTLDASEIEMLKRCAQVSQRILGIIEMIIVHTLPNQTHCELLEVLKSVTVATHAGDIRRKVGNILSEALASNDLELSLYVLKICADIEKNNVNFVQRYVGKQKFLDAVSLARKVPQNADQGIKRLAKSVLQMHEGRTHAF